MEEEDLLDPLNDLHLFVLHLVFLPYINNALEELLTDWNNHPLSSENNFSPVQLWHLGLSSYQNSHPDEFYELQNCDWDSFGIDYDGPVPEEENSVEVPETSLPLTDEQYAYLETEVSNQDHGEEIDLYIYMVDLVNTLIAEA